MRCLQVVDAKQAGASGILGLITAVTGPGTPVLSSFACSLGMDAPVEVPAFSSPLELWDLSDRDAGQVFRVPPPAIQPLGQGVLPCRLLPLAAAYRMTGIWSDGSMARGGESVLRAARLASGTPA